MASLPLWHNPLVLLKRQDARSVGGKINIAAQVGILGAALAGAVTGNGRFLLMFLLALGVVYMLHLLVPERRARLLASTPADTTPALASAPEAQSSVAESEGTSLLLGSAGDALNSSSTRLHTPATFIRRALDPSLYLETSDQPTDSSVAYAITGRTAAARQESGRHPSQELDPFQYSTAGAPPPPEHLTIHSMPLSSNEQQPVTTDLLDPFSLDPRSGGSTASMYKAASGARGPGTSLLNIGASEQLYAPSLARGGDNGFVFRQESPADVAVRESGLRNFVQAEGALRSLSEERAVLPGFAAGARDTFVREDVPVLQQELWQSQAGSGIAEAMYTMFSDASLNHPGSIANEILHGNLSGPGDF